MERERTSRASLVLSVSALCRLWKVAELKEKNKKKRLVSKPIPTRWRFIYCLRFQRSSKASAHGRAADMETSHLHVELNVRSQIHRSWCAARTAFSPLSCRLQILLLFIVMQTAFGFIPELMDGSRSALCADPTIAFHTELGKTFLFGVCLCAAFWKEKNKTVDTKLEAVFTLRYYCM